MNKKELKSFLNQNKIVLLLILISTVVLISSSYAWYTLSFTSEKAQSIVAGDLSLKLEENQNTISLTNAIPQSDSDGIKNMTYTFKVTNDGSLSSKYYVYLNDIDLKTSTTRISDAKIRFNLTKNENSNGNNYLTSLNSSKDANNNTQRVLATGTLDSKESVTFKVTLWIAEEATNDIAGQEFMAKLKIDGSQLKGIPNEPKIVGDMIPVTYNGTNWVKASYTDTDSWYNYDKQNWANVVTIKDQSKRALYKNAAIGTAINIADINTFLVWIPRYSYTLGNTYGYQIDGASTPSKATPGAFNIKFVNKNTLDKGSATYTGNMAENYYTPASFCWGDTCDTSRTDASNIELPGIWVAKFETTGTIDDLSSIPNVTSLRSQTNSAFFNGIQTQMNGTSGSTNYGFSGTSYDTHMLKNNEWGAMSYLSQSKYGKYGNSDYTGANKEIYQNKSSEFITGSSNGTPSTEATGTQVAYNVSGTGTGASTTGNISGIYDTSGGAWEPVMGNLNNAISSSGFSSMPSKRYYNLYTTENASTACNGGVCLGDALSETAGFYGDYAFMLNTQYPWVYRGGRYDKDALAGVFGFAIDDGHAGSSFSVRLGLVAW